jgi:putative transposase
MKTADLCLKHAISEASFYNWKAKYGGLEVSEAKRLKGLESEKCQAEEAVLADAIGYGGVRYQQQSGLSGPSDCSE